MNGLSHKRPSPALVVACVALFVALGGTGYAALELPRNSVGAKQLRKHSVGAKKLKKNAVNSRKVANGSLLAEDFKAGQLPAGAPGAAGAQGPKGDTGAKGATGAPGLSGLQTVTSTSPSDSGTTKEWSAKCPTGKKAISGGYDLNVQEQGFFHNIPPVYAVDNHMQGDDTWFVWAREDNSWNSDTFAHDWELVVYVTCANVTP